MQQAVLERQTGIPGDDLVLPVMTADETDATPNETAQPEEPRPLGELFEREPAIDAGLTQPGERSVALGIGDQEGVAVLWHRRPHGHAGIRRAESPPTNLCRL